MSRCALFVVLWFGFSAPVLAGVPLVELTTAKGAVRGRVTAQDERRALLLDRDGALRAVPLAEVTDYSIVAPDFRPYGSVDLRGQLQRLVGRDAEVVATPHFVVVGRPVAAKAVGETLEDVYDGYRWYCSTRRFKISDPEFPLVAVVFPNRAEFDAYCRADGVPPSGSLRGYYHHLSNRFACYETIRIAGGTLPTDVKDTVVHEAIHQIASNTGLHPRCGDLPTWVSEGLATALEPEAARRPLRSDGRPRDRANPERLQYFLDPTARISTRDLVVSDLPFKTATLDAYATAWALTFYFMEAKPTAYGHYLRTLAARDPLAEYPQDERLEDFRAAFGDDWAMLDAELLRFQRRVAAGERR